MTTPAQLYAVLDDYDLAVEAFDARRIEMALSMNELDEVLGRARGTAAKYLGPGHTKKFSVESAIAYAKAIGLRVVLEVDPKAAAKVLAARLPRHDNQARRGNHASPVSKRVLSRVNRHLSKRATEKRWAGKSPEERTAHARAMAMKRWYPNRATVKSVAGRL